jgi:hypothetical protein
VPGFQHAVAPAQWRAECVDDYGFSFHFVAFAPIRFCGIAGI